MPLDELVNAFRELTRNRSAACGNTFVVAIDGRSGSGKTSTAESLGAELGWPLVQLEHVYPGWNGLEAGINRVASCLADLAVGEHHLLPRWDWVESRPAEPLLVNPTRHLLLEGVGAGAKSIRPFLSGLIWLEAPGEVRRGRALSRDGETFAPWWDTWAEQEEKHLATSRPQDHADIVVRTG